MKKAIIFFIVTIITLNLSAQTRGLKVGAKMPNYIFSRISHFNKGKVSMKELRGKLVILDLWFSACGTCITQMPHMQELQNQFGKRIQIILVNINKNDNLASVNSVMRSVKRTALTSITLPVSLYDATLNNYFPAFTYPQEVIIGPDGTILAISDHKAITKENISKLLVGQKIPIPIKDDFRSYDLPIATFINDNSEILTSSMFAGYMPGLNNIIHYKHDRNGKEIGIMEANMPLKYWYNIAYPFDNISKYVFETTSPVFNAVAGDTTNVFTYDCIVQSENFNREKYIQLLRQDIDRTFNFSIKKEKRSIPCLIIKRNNNISISYTKWKDGDGDGQIRGEGNTSESDSKIAIKKHTAIYSHCTDPGSVVDFASHHGQLFNAEMVIDESDMPVKEGHPQEIDIDFPVDFDFDNASVVKEFFHSKGLDIAVENRELNVLVFSDKKPGDPTLLPDK